MSNIGTAHKYLQVDTTNGFSTSNPLAVNAFVKIRTNISLKMDTRRATETKRKSETQSTFVLAQRHTRQQSSKESHLYSYFLCKPPNNIANKPKCMLHFTMARKTLKFNRKTLCSLYWIRYDGKMKNRSSHHKPQTNDSFQMNNMQSSMGVQLLWSVCVFHFVLATKLLS